MISEDVCYIGRGEKQYPLGNSRKKENWPFLSFFPIFFSLSLSSSLYVSVSLTPAKLRTPRHLLFYGVLSAVCLSEIKAPLIGILLQR